MHHQLSALVFCMLFGVICHAFQIETGFPTACGNPAVKREFKEEAKRRKVRATPHSWPWHGGLLTAEYGFFPYCGGTLISRSLVVTAAHCVEDVFGCTNTPFEGLVDLTREDLAPIYFLVGAHDYMDADYDRYMYKVHYAVIHPNFTQTFEGKGYDIAILKLQKNIISDSKVSPICFPAKHVNLKWLSPCFYAGWGGVFTSYSNGEQLHPKTLREAQVHIEPDFYCQFHMGNQFADSNSCIGSRGRVSYSSGATIVRNSIVKYIQ
uniref:Chymotrypsin-like elastase family member 2A n=1 Tax=Schistocephalus solidus TaxID=70667 RepID=A0A0X3NNI0_SCHSO